MEKKNQNVLRDEDDSPSLSPEEWETLYNQSCRGLSIVDSKEMIKSLYNRYGALSTTDILQYIQHFSPIFSSHYGSFTATVFDEHVPVLHKEFLWRLLRCEFLYDAYMGWMQRAMAYPDTVYYPYVSLIHASLSTLCYSITEAKLLLNSMKIGVVRQCVRSPRGLRRFAAPYGRSCNGQFRLSGKCRRRLQFTYTYDRRLIANDMKRKVARKIDIHPAHRVLQYRERIRENRNTTTAAQKKNITKRASPEGNERGGDPFLRNVNPSRSLRALRYNRSIRYCYTFLASQDFLKSLDMDMRIFASQSVKRLRKLQRMSSSYLRSHNDVFKERYTQINSEMYITLFPFPFFNHFFYTVQKKIMSTLDRMENNLFAQYFQTISTMGHVNAIWQYHGTGPRVLTWLQQLRDRRKVNGDHDITDDEAAREQNVKQAFMEGRYDLLMAYDPIHSSYSNLYNMPWEDRRNPGGKFPTEEGSLAPIERHKLEQIQKEAEAKMEQTYGTYGRKTRLHTLDCFTQGFDSVLQQLEKDEDFFRRPLAYQWMFQRKRTVRQEKENAHRLPPLVSSSSSSSQAVKTDKDDNDQDDTHISTASTPQDIISSLEQLRTQPQCATLSHLKGNEEEGDSDEDVEDDITAQDIIRSLQYTHIDHHSKQKYSRHKVVDDDDNYDDNDDDDDSVGNASIHTDDDNEK
jgi:hypothetical protein